MKNSISRITAFLPQYILFVLISFLPVSLQAQIICSSNGNLMIFSNYDGGTLNINVDQNIPNLKIGICSYEAVIVNLTGAFVNNITEVRYAGFNSNNNHCSNIIPATAVNGAPSSASVGIVFAPPVTLNNPNGYSSIICASSCNNSTGQGGCNTIDQVEAYFLNYFSGSTLYAHKIQYNCWTGSHNLSLGGTCCPAAPLLAGSISTSHSICAGGTPSLISSGAAASGGTGPITYSWQSSSFPTSGFTNISNSNSLNYQPANLSNTTYFRRAAWSGSSVVYSNIVAITVVPLPSVVIAGPSSVCLGATANFTATGAQTYMWSTSHTTSIISVSPTSNFNYMVIGTDANGCSNTTSKFLVVNAAPLVIALADKQTICAGDSLTLTGTGAFTYLWEPGSIVGNPVTVKPVSNTVYTLTGTDANGCNNSSLLMINVDPALNIVAIPQSGLLCEGQTISSTASGAPTFTWMPGNVVSPTFTATALVTCFYTVTGQDGNCFASTQVSFEVMPAPQTTLSANRTAICAGESITITAISTGTVLYNDVILANNKLSVKPSGNNSYHFKSTNGKCLDSTSINITVTPCSSIEKNTKPFSLKIYPNPSHGNFTVNADEQQEIKLINALGQELQTVSLNRKNNFTVTFSELPSGIYFVIAENKGSYKVIVSR